MKTKTRAKNTREFDLRFDSVEDIHDLIDMSKATVLHTTLKAMRYAEEGRNMTDCKDAEDMFRKLGI